MKKLMLLIELGILLSFSCQREAEGLNKTASWKIPGSESIVEFYYLKGTMDEPDLKFKVKEIAESLFQKYSRIQVFVFYDKEFARKMDSKQEMEKSFNQGLGPGIMLLSDPEMKVKGGAMMILSKESPDPEWYYSPPSD